ncbi:MAG: CHAT domain-containing protein [Aquaticitalea sp.]
MNKAFRYFFIALTFICILPNAFAQSDSLVGIKYVERLIDQGNFKTAQTEIEQQIERFKAEKNFDTLVDYIQYTGSIKLANQDPAEAILKANSLMSYLKTSKDPYIIKGGLLELAWIYDDAGEPKKAYDVNLEALSYGEKIKDKKKAEIGNIEYNLGVRASNLGDYDLAKKHHFKALKLSKEAEIEDFETSYFVYNSVGGMMWFSAKLDSAAYYFEESLKALKKMEDNDMNRYYRPAIVKSNIAVLHHALGKNENAIALSREAISEYQKYIDDSENETMKLRGLKHQLSTIDNLASFYEDMGEYSRADELISYSYFQKVKNLEPGDPNILYSLVILGQAKMGVHDYKKSAYYLEEALAWIEKYPDTQLYWHSGALITRASVYAETGDIENAIKFYEKGEALYKKTMKQDYTKDYLDDFIEMSLFYSQHDRAEKAISLATESHHFAKNSSFKNTLQDFRHTLNLAEVYFNLKNYKKAYQYSTESLSFFEKDLLKVESSNDLMQIEYYKPKALLIEAQSKYYLYPKKDEKFLVSLLNDVEKGIDILSQRKTVVTSVEDLNLLISENTLLFDFAKQLNYDLYKMTHKQEYVDNLIKLHESSIYNRIRSRLGLKNNIAFKGVPQSVLDKETQLKKDLNASISDTEDASNAIDNLSKNTKTWNVFLESLKQNYPKYYDMRYASIERPIDNIQKNIPENTTIVRYFFIGEQVFALLIDKEKKTLFSLNFEAIKMDIYSIEDNQHEVKKTSASLYKLYQYLWQPFEDQIHTKKIVIVPDRELFNLSFEMLTPKPIASYKELATNSLLAKYIISYNYSLFLIDNGSKIGYKDDFVAFVPEFDDKMKENYKIAIHDSIDLDKAYLTLLPQPFTKDLAKSSTRLFGGESFLNEKSTEHIFKNSAKEHKIIHIGTHAESNNVSPELSRLVFAKSNDSSDTDDNYLYTYEIYNTNLSSNLAILTACETGKPSYQAGEGMISLAHAFNYAGSESILTSLWKIDEQSSAKIIDLFYKHIKKGLSKDEALQKAKLQYIAEAEGRTVNPEYWAGLILIGDTAPIEMQSSQTWIYWILAGLAFAFMFLLFLKRRHNK